MSDKVKSWLVGALNAGISGLAAAAGSVVSGVTFKQGAIIVGGSVVVSIIKWMAQHPLPGAQQ
jgi:hypothetical protein